MPIEKSVPLTVGAGGMGLLIAPNKDNTPIPSWVNRLWINLLFVASFLLVVLGENKSHRKARGKRISKATENQNQEVTGTGSIVNHVNEHCHSDQPSLWIKSQH